LVSFIFALVLRLYRSLFEVLVLRVLAVASVPVPVTVLLGTLL
jgi:hypothetical protein